jgi:hypothetical protein
VVNDWLALLRPVAALFEEGKSFPDPYKIALDL